MARDSRHAEKQGIEMTREQFLTAYRADLMARYAWANTPVKLERFMKSVVRTISTEAKTWHHDSPSTHAAWRAIGGSGRASLKGLRALPTEEVTKPVCPHYESMESMPSGRREWRAVYCPEGGCPHRCAREPMSPTEEVTSNEPVRRSG